MIALVVMTAPRFAHRSSFVARLVLVALLANVGLAAICDAMCAAPVGPESVGPESVGPESVGTESGATESVSTELGARQSVANAHGGRHCQTPPSTGARASAGHRAVLCQHEAEPSSRLAEARGPVRLELVLATWPGSPSAGHGLSAIRFVRRGSGPPAAPRAQRPLVLRV
jgi:hypothetical protein